MLSCVQLFATPWTVACQAPLFSTISWSLLKFTSSESMMLSNCLIGYTLIDFNICLYPWSYHHKQDNGHIYYLRSFSHASLWSFFLIASHPQTTTDLLSLYIDGLNGGLPKVMSTWNLWMWPYLEDVIKLRIWKWAQPSLDLALDPMIIVLIRERKDIERRRWCNGFRYCSDSSTSQGLSSITGSHQKLVKRNRTDSSLKCTEGTNPTNMLILDFSFSTVTD